MRSRAAPPPDRIVVTGDFLRPGAAALRPTQNENIDWLAKLLRVPLEMATDLPLETVAWDDNWINGARLDTPAIEAIYAAFWLRADIHGWARIYAAPQLPAAVEGLFERLFAGALVIGFELPPYLTGFCTRHGIPFIDCSISPVRFMDDLLLRLSTSDLQIDQALRGYGVAEEMIRLQAGVLSSTAAKANLRPPPPNSLLVVLQTRFDKVVIENRRFTGLLDHLETLRGIAAGYDAVLIRQHPSEPQPDLCAAVQAALPGSQVTGENFYRLVSHDNLRGVAALSSSCVAEAGYFGATGHYLLPGFTPEAFVPGQAAVDVDGIVLAPDFWRDLLGAGGCPVSAPDGLRLPAKPNRFRQHLRSAWNYNQVDTDIFVQWASS